MVQISILIEAFCFMLACSEAATRQAGDAATLQAGRNYTDASVTRYKADC